jgi:hypothetical protein
MTDVLTSHPLPFGDIRAKFAAHPVRRTEVPVEHSISLPLPSLRWGQPVFAGFAGPAWRVPGQPLELSTPDRWWALGPDGIELVVYARTSVVPFGDVPTGGRIQVSPLGRSLAEAQQDLLMLDELMNNAVPVFLSGTPGTEPMRADLAAAFAVVVPAETTPWYRALVPDFFAWLDGDGA